MKKKFANVYLKRFTWQDQTALFLAKDVTILNLTAADSLLEKTQKTKKGQMLFWLFLMQELFLLLGIQKKAEYLLYTQSSGTTTQMLEEHLSYLHKNKEKKQLKIN